MFIRIAQGSSDPSRADEIGALIREMGLPAMRQLPGIRNLYAGVDRATGQGVIVSVWDTEEQARTVPAVPELMARLQALGLQGGPPKIYEVTDEL
jgi:hypothetical protein